MGKISELKNKIVCKISGHDWTPTWRDRDGEKWPFIYSCCRRCDVSAFKVCPRHYWGPNPSDYLPFKNKNRKS